MTRTILPFHVAHFLVVQASARQARRARIVSGHGLTDQSKPIRLRRLPQAQAVSRLAIHEFC